MPASAAAAASPLARALVSYGEYHHHPWNQAIHLVCVPAILFSLLVGLAYVPSPPPLPLVGVDAPLALFLVLAYALFYALGLGAPLAALFWLACVGLPLYLGAAALAAAAPGDAWRWALALHAAGWVLQIFPGHVLFERRRPALVDSFWQALATAPLFVFVEVMFAAGWNKGLRREVAQGVEAALRAHRRKGGGGARAGG